jgi:hypothetical protein
MYLFLVFLPIATGCIILFFGDYKTFDEVGVEEFCLFNLYKELCRPFLGYFFHFLLCEFIIGLELFLLFIPTCSDVNEMPICAELHKWPELVKGIRCHARERFNGPLQL